MRSIRTFLLFIALLVCVQSLHAQGFSLMNGRNHPELKWRVATTEHFRIVYPAHLEGIEAEAAAVAEETYAALSTNLNVTFDAPLRIYLSDEDEIANGFAVDVGNGYTNLWVNVNEAAIVWTGREKWLRKVIAHELTHLFHYRAVRTNLGTLGRLISDPMPRFWAEGLAQYETEDWDSERGDRWLRTAVLEDNLSYYDGSSAWNGRLLYAVGNSQVRYFADRYGDSTLARMMKYRRKTLLGLGKVHSFSTAFRKTTGQSYSQFYDDWRRLINVYYNTTAAGMEDPDSLGVKPLRLPGAYYYAIRYSPDTTQVAVVALESLDRPVRRLYVVKRKEKEVREVAEGAIEGPISWSPDGRHIAFARLSRGRHGSMLNDLFMIRAEGGGLRRLTHSRRAFSPSFSPDGRRLAFVGSSGGTANVFVLDLASGQETPVTRYTGDVQILSLDWQPGTDSIAVARFAADGTRAIVLVDAATGAERALTSGEYDDRDPVWSPDGRQLAYTSLRDDVPNVFSLDLASGLHRRVTNLTVGGQAHDWVPPDSLRPGGGLILVAMEEKERDWAYRIDAARQPFSRDVRVPEDFATWTTVRPPWEVAKVIPPNPDLVRSRKRYSSWHNILHAATLALPYYDDPKDWGIIGTTVWMEPLGKHVFSFLGGISFATPAENSLFVASYVNNQWHPTVGVSLYRIPGNSRYWGDEMLVENYAGGEVTAVWPLNWRVRPYTSMSFSTRLRYVGIDPLNESDLDRFGLAAPESGRQADLRLTLMRRRQRPYRFEAFHPLDGTGVRLQLDAAGDVLGARSRFLRGDVSAYTIVPVLGTSNFFMYGRAQAQTGRSFVQDYIGLSRYDEIQVGIPGYLPFSFSDVERVRGYRDYAIGNRVLFGSVEYRVPLVPDLQTQLLGLVSLGGASLAMFADGALVGDAPRWDNVARRLGVGLELKSSIRLAVVEFGHALGVAQPAHKLGETDDYEVYYRIRAAVPF